MCNVTWSMKSQLFTLNKVIRRRGDLCPESKGQSMLGPKVSIYVFGQLICLLIGFMLVNESKSNLHQGHSGQKGERDRNNLLCSVWKVLCQKEGILTSTAANAVNLNCTSKVCSTLQDIWNKKNSEAQYSSSHHMWENSSNSSNHGNHMTQNVPNSKDKKVLMKFLQNHPDSEKINFEQSKVSYSTDFPQNDYFIKFLKTRRLKMYCNNAQKNSDISILNSNVKNGKDTLIDTNSKENLTLIEMRKNISFTTGIDPVDDNAKILDSNPFIEVNSDKPEIDTEVSRALENDSKQTALKFRNKGEVTTERFKEQLHLNRSTTISKNISNNKTSALPTPNSVSTFTIPLKDSPEQIVDDKLVFDKPFSGNPNRVYQQNPGKNVRTNFSGDKIPDIHNETLIYKSNRTNISLEYNRTNNQSGNITDFVDLVYLDNLNNTKNSFLNNSERIKKTIVKGNSSTVNASVTSDSSDTYFTFNALELEIFNSTEYKPLTNKSVALAIPVQNSVINVTLFSENSNGVHRKEFPEEDTDKFYSDAQTLGIPSDKYVAFSEEFIEDFNTITTDEILLYFNSSEKLEDQFEFNEPLEPFLNNSEIFPFVESGDFSSEIQNKSLIPKTLLAENIDVPTDLNYDILNPINAVTESNLAEIDESITENEPPSIFTGIKLKESISSYESLNLNVADGGSEEIPVEESEGHYEEKNTHHTVNIELTMDETIKPEEVSTVHFDIPGGQTDHEKEFNINDYKDAFTDSKFMRESEEIITDPMESTFIDFDYNEKFTESNNILSLGDKNFKQKEIYGQTVSHDKESDSKDLFDQNISTALDDSTEVDVNMSLKTFVSSEAFTTSQAYIETNKINTASVNTVTDNSIFFKISNDDTISEVVKHFETNSSEKLLTEESFEISDANDMSPDNVYSELEFEEDYENARQAHGVDSEAYPVSGVSNELLDENTKQLSQNNTQRNEESITMITENTINNITTSNNETKIIRRTQFHDGNNEEESKDVQDFPNATFYFKPSFEVSETISTATSKTQLTNSSVIWNIFNYNTSADNHTSDLGIHLNSSTFKKNLNYTQTFNKKISLSDIVTPPSSTTFSKDNFTTLNVPSNDIKIDSYSVVSKAVLHDTTETFHQEPAVEYKNSNEINFKANTRNAFTETNDIQIPFVNKEVDNSVAVTTDFSKTVHPFSVAINPKLLKTTLIAEMTTHKSDRIGISFQNNTQLYPVSKESSDDPKPVQPNDSKTIVTITSKASDSSSVVITPIIELFETEEPFAEITTDEAEKPEIGFRNNLPFFPENRETTEDSKSAHQDVSITGDTTNSKTINPPSADINPITELFRETAIYKSEISEEGFQNKLPFFPENKEVSEDSKSVQQDDSITSLSINSMAFYPSSVEINPVTELFRTTSFAPMTPRESDKSEISFQNESSFFPKNKQTSEDSKSVQQDNSITAVTVNPVAVDLPSVAINPLTDLFRATSFVEVTTPESEKNEKNIQNKLSFFPENRHISEDSFPENRQISEDSKSVQRDDSTAAATINSMEINLPSTGINPITELFREMATYESEKSETGFQNKLPFFPKNMQTSEDTKSVQQDDLITAVSINSMTVDSSSVVINPITELFQATPFAEMTINETEKPELGFRSNLPFFPENRQTTKDSKSAQQNESITGDTINSKTINLPSANINTITELFLETATYESEISEKDFQNKLPSFPENRHTSEDSKSVQQDDPITAVPINSTVVNPSSVAIYQVTDLFRTTPFAQRTPSETDKSETDHNKSSFFPDDRQSSEDSKSVQQDDSITASIVSSNTILESSDASVISITELFGTTPLADMSTEASYHDPDGTQTNFQNKIPLFPEKEVTTEGSRSFPQNDFKAYSTFMFDSSTNEDKTTSIPYSMTEIAAKSVTPSKITKELSKPFDPIASDSETYFRNDFISTPVNNIRTKDLNTLLQHSTVDIFSLEKNDKSISGAKLTTEVSANSLKWLEERFEKDFFSTPTHTAKNYLKDTDGSTKYLDDSKTYSSKAVSITPGLEEVFERKYSTIISEAVTDNYAKIDLTLDEPLKKVPVTSSDVGNLEHKTEINSVKQRDIKIETVTSSFERELDSFSRVSKESTYSPVNERNQPDNSLTERTTLPDYIEKDEGKFISSTIQLAVTEVSENNLANTDFLTNSSLINNFNINLHEKGSSIDSVEEQKIEDLLIRTERDVLKHTEKTVDADQPANNIDTLGGEVIRTERDLSSFDEERRDFDSNLNKKDRILEESLFPLPDQLDDIDVNMDGMDNEDRFTLNPPELLSSPVSLGTKNRSFNLQPNIEVNIEDTKVTLNVPKEFGLRPEVGFPGNSKIGVTGTVKIGTSGEASGVSGSINATVGANVTTMKNISFDKTKSENNLTIDVSSDLKPPDVFGKRDSETDDINSEVNFTIVPFSFNESIITATTNSITSSQSDESADNNLSPQTPSPNMNSKSEVEVEYEDFGDNPLSLTTITPEEEKSTTKSYRSTVGPLTTIMLSTKSNDQGITEDAEGNRVIKPLITSAEGTTALEDKENTVPNIFMSSDRSEFEESVSTKEPKDSHSSSTRSSQDSTVSQYQTTIATTESTIIPFHFTIDANYDEIVGSRKKKFEEHLTKQLGIAMRVPLDCVQNLQVKKGSIEVNFDLVSNPEHGHLADEKALKAAADELKRMIDSGQITINDLDGNTLVVVPLDPPTEPPPANKMEHTTLILGVVIGAFILTVITVAIAAIVVKRKSNVDHRMSPIEEARSKLPSYREIPFQEALFMKGANRNKLMLGKYCYETGQWLGPGPEPKLFHPPESVLYRPPTDSEIRRTPRPPTAVRERLKYDWEVDWDSVVSSR